MQINDLIGGTKLELNIYNEANEKVELVCISEFQWAENEQTALIAAPIIEGVVYPLHVKTAMDVYFFKETGIAYGVDLFRFRATVAGRDRSDNIELIRISVDGEIYKIQRREFFRFAFNVPVEYRVIKSMEPFEPQHEEFVSTITGDLSGGGACIKLIEPVPRDSLVECRLKLNEKTIVPFLGKVVRLSKLGKSSKYTYEIGLLFERIEIWGREDIIKFIFEQQRKLRKKGLI